MNSYNRELLESLLSNFCYLAKSDDFVETMKGYSTKSCDIVINSVIGQQNITLTYDKASTIIHITNEFNLVN